MAKFKKHYGKLGASLRDRSREGMLKIKLHDAKIALATWQHAEDNEAFTSSQREAICKSWLESLFALRDWLLVIESTKVTKLERQKEVARQELEGNTARRNPTYVAGGIPQVYRV